jgi:uncharacterized protein YbcV (DUF1398 family)
VTGLNLGSVSLHSLSEHQRGLCDYLTLCRLVGELGVAKWVCDLFAMTCSYFDKAGQKTHVELIPVGKYKNYQAGKL